MSERITVTILEGHMDEHGGEHDSETQRVLHQQRKEVADQIALALGETEVEPRKTIYRVVKKLGRDQTLLFVQRTLEIEQAGGLMVPDQSRRRTTGGVFFFLVKSEVPAEVTRHIFSRRQPPHLKKKPSTQELHEAKNITPLAAPEAKRAEPFTWEDRIAVLADISRIEERGEVKSVKVTLIGRPGKIVQQGQCIVTTMQQQAKLPALPRGLPIPTPDQIEPTLFVVYIATKQWRKVADAVQDPLDLLIVEGVQLLDKKLPNAIAVFASNVTTKNIQAATRQAAPSSPSKQQAAPSSPSKK